MEIRVISSGAHTCDPQNFFKMQYNGNFELTRPQQSEPIRKRHKTHS